MGKFDGKTALIGGNLGKIKKEKFKMGLGGVIAKQLLDDGAQVVLVDAEFNVAQECAKALGGQSKAVECDLFKDRTYETEEYLDHRGNKKTKVVWKDNPALKLVEDIAQEYGKLDILITNFDKFEKARLDSTSDEMYINLREQNITPTFHLLAAVRELFSAQRKTTGTYAKVVMITSMVGKAGMSMGAIYSAFKGAIVGLTKSLGREFGRFANVNTIAVGPFSEKKMQGPREKIRDGFMATQTDMANQPITFEKIAPLAAFLASDDAIVINGQIISADGGLWLKLEQ